MYKYIGIGFIVGIPARDISAAEFDKMSAADQQTVKECGLYKFIKQAGNTAKEK